MVNLNKKVLKTLEFNKILELLKEKAISEKGKELCEKLEPLKSLQEIEDALKETTEATSIIYRKGSLPLGGIRDITLALKRAEFGGTLSIYELLAIGDFVHVVKKAINYSCYDNKNDYFELIENHFKNLQPLNDLEKQITSCIESENSIYDTASNELNDIRRKISSNNAKIKEMLNKIIAANQGTNILQDTVITIRNGRYCLPVKQEHRKSFNGLVHERSSTGATLFMEPMVVVNLNNDTRELEQKEKVEIDKILKKLSLLVFENKDLLYANFEILTYLDFVFAKGELSIKMQGIAPKFNSHGYINIKRGKHPLLSGDIVPIDIYLGDAFTMLLITGPNTGGKTVSLKTLGLFTLMGQAGLHISALDNSELSIFDEVFADIGDEQSIEQSLSTFSSHMTNIVSILKNVTPNSLVLLDELGAGTDPTEGAALAISILQHLNKNNIRTALTTHYAELKLFALSTDNVENASCEFDVATLRPTYKLLIGVPGKSNAFAISKKLGLSDDIISRAKEIVSSENIKFEDVITDLEISRKNAELEMSKAEMYRTETEKLKADFESKKQKLESQKEKIIEKAKQDALKIMQEAKEQADSLVRQLQKEINNKGSLKDADNLRTKLKENVSDLESSLSKTKKSKNIKPITKKLSLGDRVYINTWNQAGELLTLPDSNNEVMVQSGILKLKVSFSDLSIDDSKEEVEVKKTYTQSVKKDIAKFIKPEIDLRGNLAMEAIEKLDKYLDDASLSGLHQVTIIHGKGTGALREAIKVFLKKNPAVKSFRLGSLNEGDSGVTVAELH